MEDTGTLSAFPTKYMLYDAVASTSEEARCRKRELKKSHARDATRERKPRQATEERKGRERLRRPTAGNEAGQRLRLHDLLQATEKNTNFHCKKK